MDLFDKVEIGDLEIKNRFAMAPMISNLGNYNGYTNEIHTSYLEERAKGGFGLIITEYSYIDSPLSRGSRNELSFSSYDQIPRLKRLTERIHSYDSKIFAQLVHAGGKALTENNQVAFAPSPIPYAGKMPHELTIEQIEDIKIAFLKAARIAELSNFDGVELHGAHAYLLQEFISPGLNKREDKYGKDFNGRIKLPQEIVELIKKETSLKVGIRLSLYEDEKEGYDGEYGLKVAESLKDIDYVHFSSGRMEPPGSSASYYYPKNHIGRKLPRKPKVTTIMVGSIVDRDSAYVALEKSDMVAIGRGSLADPYFPLKIKNNIMPRPCIRCNQACRDLSYGQVRCTVNPVTGNETHYLRESGNSNVRVGGAGISGMEAAIYLAKTGFTVDIFESSNSIGGQLNIITNTEKRREFSKLLLFYENEIKRLGIRLHLNSTVNNKDVDIFLHGSDPYNNLEPAAELFIDSNIYKHLDQALDLAKDCKIYMTERSIHNLDRHRQMEYVKEAESKGITFVSKPDERFKTHYIVKNQYDIYNAALKGIASARCYIAEKNEKISNSVLP
jgi:2,4-dienoyl-CoA reductase-like NADH-dependent reductase (Old Yellow Enzyme family)